MADAGLKIILGFLEAVANNIQSIVEAGISIAVNFILGIAEKLPEVIDAAFKLIISFINGLAEAIRGNHQALFDAVGNLISAIIQAIVDGIVSVGRAAGDLISGNNGVLDALGSFVKDIFDAGANLVQGFINGLTSMPGQLWDAAKGLATDAWNAITQTLDEHSPSRVTFGGGANFVLGFINGIDSLRDKAALSAGAVAFAAMEAFNDNIDASTIYSPTITPVIDASEIQNGISNMSTMFDSIPATYNITGDIEASNALQRQMFDVASQPSDYSTILNRMDSLEQSFESMIDRLGNLAIVMDSGELVGAIASPMDNALGMRQTMMSRGAL
jgi:phage-related protein